MSESRQYSKLQYPRTFQHPLQILRVIQSPPVRTVVVKRRYYPVNLSLPVGKLELKLFNRRPSLRRLARHRQHQVYLILRKIQAVKFISGRIIPVLLARILLYQLLGNLCPFGISLHVAAQQLKILLRTKKTLQLLRQFLLFQFRPAADILLYLLNIKTAVRHLLFCTLALRREAVALASQLHVLIIRGRKLLKNLQPVRVAFCKIVEIYSAFLGRLAEAAQDYLRHNILVQEVVFRVVVRYPLFPRLDARQGHLYLQTQTAQRPPYKILNIRRIYTPSQNIDHALRQVPRLLRFHARRIDLVN